MTELSPERWITRVRETLILSITPNEHLRNWCILVLRMLPSTPIKYTCLHKLESFVALILVLIILQIYLP